MLKVAITLQALQSLRNFLVALIKFFFRTPRIYVEVPPSLSKHISERARTFNTGLKVSTYTKYKRINELLQSKFLLNNFISELNPGNSYAKSFRNQDIVKEISVTLIECLELWSDCKLKDPRRKDPTSECGLKVIENKLRLNINIIEV